VLFASGVRFRRFHIIVASAPNIKRHAAFQPTSG
jgi:hypothetical protein